MEYADPFVKIIEFIWQLNMVKLAVGVSKSLLYVILPRTYSKSYSMCLLFLGLTVATAL